MACASASRRSRVGWSAGAASRNAMSAPTSSRPSRRYASRSPSRSAWTTGAVASGAGVVPPVDAGQPCRRCPETRQRPERRASPLGGQALERRTDRTGGDRPASSTRRRGRHPPTAGACRDRRRAAGWRARATSSGRRGVGAGADRGTSGLSDARQDRAPTGRPSRGGRRPAARRHENLGKSGCQIPPGRAEDRSARYGCQMRRGEATVRPGRTRDRRDGCRRTGPIDRPRTSSPGPGMGTGRMISRTSPLRQKRRSRSAIQRRTHSGSPWNWNGPGLMMGRSVQLTGVWDATMSSRLIRQGCRR